MKYIKRILLALLILLLLPLAAAFIAMTFYKTELSGLLADHLKTEYGLSTRVRAVHVSLLGNWPDATIRLDDAVVQSLVNPSDTTPLFRAGSLELSFNLPKLLSKQFIVNSISVKDASITLIKDSLDGSNFKFIHKPDTSHTGKSIHFDLKKIRLKAVKFQFINKARRQHISAEFRNNTLALVHYSDGVQAHLEGQLYIDRLLFKPEKGPFMKEAETDVSLNILYHVPGKHLFIDNSSRVRVNGQEVYFGLYAGFAEDEKRLVLHLAGDKLNAGKIIPLLNDNIQHALREIRVDKPVSVDALVIAAIGKRQDPQFVVKIKGKDNGIQIGNTRVPYGNVDFEAVLSCVARPGEEADIERAKMVFPRISGKIYDFPFRASLSIRNFKTPFIQLKAGLDIEGSKIRFNPGKDFVLRGSCKASIAYSGPASGLHKESFLEAPMKLKATVLFKQLSYKSHPGSAEYVVNGSATVDNNDLRFDALSLQTLGGTLTLAGVAEGFTHYIVDRKNGFRTRLQAHTALYDLNPLLAHHKNTKQEAPAVEKKRGIKAPSGRHFPFQLSLQADKLLARKIVATQVHAALSYDNDLLTVSSLGMTACGGKLSAKGTLDRLEDLKVRVLLQDMDVRLLMEQFENFGQKAIVSQNLKGRLNADAEFKSRLDGKLEVLPETMSGEVSVKLMDGHLLDFEPFQRVSTFVFKNRDFKDIMFAEMEQTFIIKGQEFHISNLEIASSVLNVYVDGVYHFKGESNINLRIPWSNLKKRGAGYVAKSLGKEGEDAKGLKLNFHGFPNKLKLSLGNK